MLAKSGDVYLRYWVIKNVVFLTEIGSLWWNKTEFLPKCGCVDTTVWMYCLYTDETNWEKARLELHKTAVCCLEQILGVVAYKTAAVRPLTSHPTNHPNKTSKTYWALLLRRGRTHKRCSLMNSYTRAHQCCSTRKDLYRSALCGHWMQSMGPAWSDEW